MVTDLGVTFGAVESVLERRAEAERLGTELAGREAEVADLRAAAVRLAAEAQAATDAVEAARGGGESRRRRPPSRRGGRTVERPPARGGRPRGVVA